MTRYRLRAVLLLFLLLNLTACITWQSIGPVSPSRFIEAEQPDRVRVTTEDVTELEVLGPSVEGDELVAPGNFSIPFADILRLEAQRFSLQRTLIVGAWVGVYTGVFLVLSLIEEVKY